MTTAKENMTAHPASRKDSAAHPAARNPGRLAGGGNFSEDFMINRQHKDRLFRMIFQDKKDLLSLYNAVNGSHYTDPEGLEISTIEDVLYMGMKNDVSFLIDEYLNLYEAQSTWNPNIPLRGIFYFSRLYSGYIKTRKLDIHSQTRISLPTPRYIVFYNGMKKVPERSRLRLSDSFIRQDGQESCLECIALVLNINLGQNQKLKEGCRRLYEYAFLTEQIRLYLAEGLKLEAAVDAAVEVCVENEILSDFLIKHRAEVKEMILSEYDEELHLKNTYNCGYTDGQESLSRLITILIKEKRMDDLERAVADASFRRDLLRKYGLENE